MENKKKKGTSLPDALLILLLLCYIAAMAQILLFKNLSPGERVFSGLTERSQHANLTFFLEIKRYLLSGAFSKTAIVANIFGNVALFVPLAMFFQIGFGGRKKLLTALLCCLISIAAETAQYFLRLGFADVDDVILNTLGGLFGILLFAILQKLFPDKKRLKQVCIILLTIMGGMAVYTALRSFPYLLDYPF